jgi:glycosyltransferase involved in cell wall biosynthesis
MPPDLTVLIPVFNDWHSLDALLRDLDAVLAAHEILADLLIVDDCSHTPAPDAFPSASLSAIASGDILRLRRNLGHQRAIAIGLASIHAREQVGVVLVMDGDGEDRPADVPSLLEEFRRHGGARVVFAARTRRTEDWWFRLFYWMYRVLHLVLTGVSVRVGNFSVLPSSALSTLVVVSELWNHYAAAVFKSQLPYTTVPLARGTRYFGHSRMNFTSLVIHGLSGISVFGDIVGGRLLAAAAALGAIATLALLGVVSIRFGTSLAIPGWATLATGLLLVLLGQLVVACLLFVFVVLAARTNLTFLPIRDYQYFVATIRRMFPLGD